MKVGTFQCLLSFYRFRDIPLKDTGQLYRDFDYEITKR